MNAKPTEFKFVYESSFEQEQMYFRKIASMKSVNSSSPADKNNIFENCRS